MGNILSAVMLWLFLLSGWSWLQLWSRGRPALPWAARTQSPWTLFDVGSAFLIMLFFPLAVISLANSLGLLVFEFGQGAPTANQLAGMLVCNAIGSVLTIGVLWGLMRLRHAAHFHDWGFDRRHFIRDLGLGAAAFVLVIPPVLIMQSVLTLWFPPEHAITTLLTERRDPLFFLIAGVSAVMIAPISEELIFRVLLQGWLERWSTVSRTSEATDDAPADIEIDANKEETPPQKRDQQKIARSADDHSPSRSLLRGAEVSHETLAAVDAEISTPAWPIFVSATLFGLVHWGNGPSPLPLFFLALGLGYLYHRTHRITPCIVMHMLLNGMTLTMIWLNPGEQ